MMSYIGTLVNKMCGCGMCGDAAGFRNFLTREEKIEVLKEYKGSLEKEVKGIGERIKDLQKDN